MSVTSATTAGWARRAMAAICEGLVLGGLIVAAGSATAPATPRGATAPRSGQARIAGLARTARSWPLACTTARPGQARCFVLARPQYAVNRALAAGQPTRPVGWTPQQLERAYRLPAGRQSHQTVAVSIAFHTPDLGSYLATYRKQFGLPPCGAGCLRVVDQRGQAKVTAPSSVGTNWDLEATLDVSMISVACPTCKILVVESNSASLNDLAATENTAARLGARVISNSYGARETGLSQTFTRSYRHPGHMIVAASGDSGFDAANFPANLSSVTAVGGTTLSRARNPRRFTERVWDQLSLGASTSSCSVYVAKPAWQHDPHCPGRTIADVSAVAANIPIFNRAHSGWISVAGTSVAAPLIAGIYGLAGNAEHRSVRDLYQHAARLFDVTRGNNVLGSTPQRACGSDYLCQAKRGYDAPTGLGTPDGLGAF